MRRSSVYLAKRVRLLSSNAPIGVAVAEEGHGDAQAPNRTAVWSTSQQPRSAAFSGPRFLQVDKDAQPRPLAAIELLAQQPVERIASRIVACDGGGALGHPRIYINLDDASMPHSCGYCGKRYQQSSGH